MTGTTVLVTDGEQRSALAATRSLGRAGHRVHVCSPSLRPLAGASRWAANQEEVPDPLDRPADHARAVASLVREIGADVVLPVTEAALLSVLPDRERMNGAVVPFGAEDAFRALSDKERVWEEARTLGLPVPEQIVLRNPDDGIPSDTQWPLVVKPARSVTTSDAGRRKETVRHTSTRAELKVLLETLGEGSFPVLLQRRIHGPGVGIFLLRWDGETRAVFAHRRLREKPPEGGVSVYRESVAADPELVRRCEELLDRFDWSGVAMVEFKRDSETGDPYVMEVNARLWGSLQLAVDAGVDFPQLLVEAALGSPAQEPPDYRTGLRCRWLWGDVDHFLARLKGAVPGDDASGRPRRLQALAEFVTWRRGDRLEVLDPSDPRPFFRETAQWAWTLTAERSG